MLGLAGQTLWACGPVFNEGDSTLNFGIPRSRRTEFLSAPWPSIVTRDPLSTRIDLNNFPNPSESPTVEEFIQLFKESATVSRAGALFIQSPAGIDTTTLPQSGTDSLELDAALFAETLDSRAERIPLEWKYHDEDTAFLPAGTLVVRPLLGASLPEAFAVVLRSSVLNSEGGALRPSEDLRALMTCTEIEGLDAPPDCAPYERLLDRLDEAPDNIAMMAILEPKSRGEELLRYAQSVRQIPVPATLISLDDSRDYDVYRGTFPLTQFQQGTAPFSRLDGTSGSFLEDDEGNLVSQSIEDVVFNLSVPKGTAPEGGFPVVIFAHGTGGNLNSSLGTSERRAAPALTARGIAVLGISEPLHATRRAYSEGTEELRTFNFLNPLVARDIWRQSALEKVQLVTALQTLRIPGALFGQEVELNPEKIGLFGHSQGGNVAALVAAVDERVQGVFLSGTGAGLIEIISEKKEPVNIADVLNQALTLDETDVDRFHPLMTLLQMFAGPSDPIEYGALFQSRQSPHLVLTSGRDDLFTPLNTHAALATSYGLFQVDPVVVVEESMSIRGLGPKTPAEAFVETAAGETKARAFLQYEGEGHFAVFDNLDARGAWHDFFDTLFNANAPVIVPRR